LTGKTKLIYSTKTQQDAFLKDHITDNEVSRACSTHGREDKCIQKYRLENLKESDQWEYPDTDGMTLKWALRRRIRGGALGSSGSGSGPMVGSCEHSNEHSGSINCVEFLDCLSDY
jgi:hypothetical protein